MLLGTEVGLGPGHIVSNGDPAPPRQRRGRQFSTHLCYGQMAEWIKMPLGMEVGLGPGDFVLDGNHALPSQKWGGAPKIRPMSIAAKQLHGQDATW